MKSNFGLLILLSIFFQFECQSSTGSNCSQSDNDNMDLIVSKIFTIGKTGRKFPETLDQGPPYCKYESYEIILTYNEFVIQSNKELP